MTDTPNLLWTDCNGHVWEPYGRGWRSGFAGSPSAEVIYLETGWKGDKYHCRYDAKEPTDE